MSDSNNNAYVSSYDVTIDNISKLKYGSRQKIEMDTVPMLNHHELKRGHGTFNPHDGSIESLEEFDVNVCDSTDDDCAFLSDVTDTGNSMSSLASKASQGFRKPRYTRSRSRSSLGNRSSVGSRTLSRQLSRGKQRGKRDKEKRSRSGTGSDVTDEVIREDVEVTTYQRSISSPLIVKSREEHKSRLQRRRSAVTFQSTYRTLSAPPRISPVRPSLGSLIVSATPSVTSIASGTDACCYGNSFPLPKSVGRTHRHGNWSNLMTCLAHKKENGVRMTQTQVLIRRSLEKAIQKAGYNMNELALSHSPNASPMVARKTEPKCSVDWTETAMIGEHIWAPSNVTGDLCYVGEDQCTKSGARKKCSACHIVVHESCMEQLDKIGFQCKVTFREASTRNLRENLTVRHHWVHRRRQDGKCRQCGKAFEKRFGFRDSKILAISCSWCKEAYHNKVSCFRMQKINETCTLGAHARIVVPPTWIVKWTPRGKSGRNRSKKKRASGMWRKKSSREGRQRLFVIRPLPEHIPYLSPTIVFINPKSGGNQGVKIMQTFQWLLNQRQVFNLAEGGPREALEMFRKVPNLRILACGGDGTVGWILSVLDELNMTRTPPVAILPLGTGNDLSRTLNWGPGYTDEPISKILQHVEEGKVVQLDRWKVTVTPNEEALHDEDGEAIGACSDGGSGNLPLDVVNAYFSIGADARVSLQFHESREAHPGKFNSRIGNKFFYVRSGVSGYISSKEKNLGKYVKLVCDGKDITPKIQAIKPVCIVLLNIPRYSAGFLPWGHPTGTEFQPQMHDDKLIEVLAFTHNQLGMIYVGGHGERLCQCSEVEMTTTKTIPVQIDGEPCRLNPSIIKMSFHNQANMIFKSKHRGSIPLLPDQPVSEQLKICINMISLEKYTEHNGDKSQLRELSRPSHTTVVPADADLENVRRSIERIQQQDQAGTNRLSEQFTFLDLSSGDRFYSIDRTQESLHLVRELATSDGELYVLDLISPTKSQGTSVDMVPLSSQLSRFPRSNQVDRSTRRRIFSDTTNSQYARQDSITETIPLKTPGPTSSVEEEEWLSNKLPPSSTNFQSTHEESQFNDSDVTEERRVTNINNDVTDEGSKVNNEEQQSGTAANDDAAITPPEKSDVNKLIGSNTEILNPPSDLGLSDDAKRSSLPTKLTQQDMKANFKRRPLSYTSHDTDVVITKNSSKPTHCDIIKTESYASVFSSPTSSKHDSPKYDQDVAALWSGTMSSASSTEFLEATDENDSLPVATVNSPRSVSRNSSRDDGSLNHETNSRKSSDTSPTITVTMHEEFEGQAAAFHEKIGTTSEEMELLSQRMISRKSGARSTLSSIPNSRKEKDLKKRSNTAAGMPLSVFVKTQTTPPTETLHSPTKNRTSRSPSPEVTKQRSLTLNEFVSNLKDVPYSDEISTVSDSRENTVPVTMTTTQTFSGQDIAASNTSLVTRHNNGDLDRSSTQSSEMALEGGHPAVSINDVNRLEIVNDNQSNNLSDVTDERRQKMNKQLSDSSKRGDIHKLKLALLGGAIATSLDCDGSTALHNAARFNHVEIVQYFIEEGPTELLNMIDRDRKQTALHKAAWFGHKKVCEQLVIAGASLSSLDYKGMTPLERAQQAEDKELVKFLSQATEERMKNELEKENKETDL